MDKLNTEMPSPPAPGSAIRQEIDGFLKIFLAGYVAGLANNTLNPYAGGEVTAEFWWWQQGWDQGWQRFLDELATKQRSPNDRTELRLPGSAATTTPKI